MPKNSAYSLTSSSVGTYDGSYSSSRIIESPMLYKRIRAHIYEEMDGENDIRNDKDVTPDGMKFKLKTIQHTCSPTSPL